MQGLHLGKKEDMNATKEIQKEVARSESPELDVGMERFKHVLVCMLSLGDEAHYRLGEDSKCVVKARHNTISPIMT